MQDESAIEKWKASAEAWIIDQGEKGDRSRRAILDPALEQQLPDVAGKQVLDLGCGEGRYSRILKSKGAFVTGVDPVRRFLDRASQLDPDSTYVEAFAESLPLKTDQFDVVLSYLSLIDIPDLEQAADEIRRVVKPSGRVVIVTISNLASTTDSWVKDTEGNKLYRKVDRYMEHFALDLEWRNIRVKNFHRPLSYVLSLFFERGFLMERFLEPLPAKQDRNFQEEFRVPNFQIYTFRYLPDLE